MLHHETDHSLAPAWYIIRSKHPVAKWVNLLHLPYTVWHLSYVIFGALLGADLNLAVLGWLVLAFTLGMGIAAHSADLLKGDPLRLNLNVRHLVAALCLSLLAASSIGIWLILSGQVANWLVLAIVLGVVFAVGYGREWPLLHVEHFSFPVLWAVFPLLVSYFAQGIQWSWALLPACAFAFLSAHCQRTLSLRARAIRRGLQVNGQLLSKSGSPLSVPGDLRPWVLRPLDNALMALSLAMPMAALTLLFQRLL